MRRKMSANEIEIVRANAQSKTDRQIGEILGLSSRDVMRERLGIGLRKSWGNAWRAGQSNLERDAERRDRWKRRSDCGRSREKSVFLISDVQPTARPEILEITLADDGRRVRVRRDLVEFYQGRAVVPSWYFKKIMAGHE